MTNCLWQGVYKEKRNIFIGCTMYVGCLELQRGQVGIGIKRIKKYMK